MNHKLLSNLDVVVMLLSFVAVGLSIPVSAWAGSELFGRLHPTPMASMLVYAPIALLVVAAFYRKLSGQHR